MSKEMEHNHSAVVKASTSTALNTKFNPSKTHNQNQVESVTIGTKNVESLCKSIASKNLSNLKRG